MWYSFREFYKGAREKHNRFNAISVAAYQDYHRIHKKLRRNEESMIEVIQGCVDFILLPLGIPLLIYEMGESAIESFNDFKETVSR